MPDPQVQEFLNKHSFGGSAVWLQNYYNWRQSQSSPPSESNKNNMEYLDRVDRIYSSYVSIGYMTPQQKEQIMTDLRDLLFPEGRPAADIKKVQADLEAEDGALPLYKELVESSPWVASSFVEQEVASVIKEKSKRDIASQEYVAPLTKYLQNAVDKKQITPEQSMAIFEDEVKKINMGIQPELLANFKGVQEFLEFEKFQKEEKKTTERMEGIARVKSANQKPIDSGTFVSGRPPVSADYLELQPRIEMSNMWEQWKQEQLSRLGGSDDWITKWQLQHADNPFAWGREGEERDDAFRVGMEGGGQKWLQAREAPPTPGWMTSLVPGQEAGQTLRKTGLPTPSGQQLAGLLPSQMGALSGYAGYTGGSWADTLAQAKKMQPETPFVRSSWKPSYQRNRR